MDKFKNNFISLLHKIFKHFSYNFCLVFNVIYTYPTVFYNWIPILSSFKIKLKRQLLLYYLFAI